MTIKINKAIGCLSLSKGCLLFGLLDLTIGIIFIVHFSMLVHDAPDTKNILYLVTAVIEVYTCAMMMCGSKMDNHWLLIPHLGWVIMPIISFAIAGVMLIHSFFSYGEMLSVMMLAANVSYVLFVWVYYWIIMYNRYLEIQRKQSTPADLIGME